MIAGSRREYGLWPGAVIGKIPGKMSNVAHLVSGADRLFDERLQPGTSDSAYGVILDGGQEVKTEILV